MRVHIRVHVLVHVQDLPQLFIESSRRGSTSVDRTLGSGWKHREIGFEFEYLGEFEFVLVATLGYESEDLRTCLGGKTRIPKIWKWIEIALLKKIHVMIGSKGKWQFFYFS